MRQVATHIFAFAVFACESLGVTAANCIANGVYKYIKHLFTLSVVSPLLGTISKQSMLMGVRINTDINMV